MRHWLLGALVAGLSLAMVPTEADAKRVGGARSSGMQRQTPDKPIQKAPAQPDATPNAAPAAPAAVPGAAAAATAAKAAPAAQAARRSWTGPLMGLAAGLGLAALFSHLGMGEAFSSIIMMVLIGLVGFALLRWFMSRRASARGDSGMAMAGASAGAAAGSLAGAAQPSHATSDAFTGMARTAAPSETTGLRIGSALNPPLAMPGVTPDAGAAQGAAAKAERNLPGDFDTAAFERIAKMIFIRLQAANDERNLDDLRAFTTPEMFAELRTDLLDRGDAAQVTEVVSVNPTIVDFAEEGSLQIVSVRYVGVVREQANAPATSFDEVWHLVRERDGGPAWRIAGIQQMA
jgi:predicted lipid-binding transport protein (Tim44 family)